VGDLVLEDRAQSIECRQSVSGRRDFRISSSTTFVPTWPSINLLQEYPVSRHDPQTTAFGSHDHSRDIAINFLESNRRVRERIAIDIGRGDCAAFTGVRLFWLQGGVKKASASPVQHPDKNVSIGSSARFRGRARRMPNRQSATADCSTPDKAYGCRECRECRECQQCQSTSTSNLKFKN
jgi:hypothetical protein